MQYPTSQYTNMDGTYTHPMIAHTGVPRAMLGSMSSSAAMASTHQSPTAPLVIPQPRHLREDASTLLQRYVGRPPTPERTYAAHRDAVFTAPSEYYNWQPALARGIRPEQLAMTIAPAVLESGSPVTPNPVVDIQPRSSTTEISVRPAEHDVPGGVKRRKKTPEPRKPMMMACLFCRGRKIACGAPALGAADRTCEYVLLVASRILNTDAPIANVANEESGANTPRNASVVTSDFLRRIRHRQRHNNNLRCLRTVLQCPQLLYRPKWKAYHRITSFQRRFSHQLRQPLIRSLLVSDMLHRLQSSLALSHYTIT
jgi:hypothetical protein